MAQNFVLMSPECLQELIQQSVHDAMVEFVPVIAPSSNTKWYTIKDVAQRWGVCPQTIWRYVKEKRIKAAKVGRLVRFEKDYIDSLKSLGEVKTPGRIYISKAERNIRAGNRHSG